MNNPFDQWYWKLGESLRSADYSLEQAEQLARLVALQPPGRVLDAGCGYGRLAGPLHQKGWTVVGVDRSPDMIHLAGELNPGPTYLNRSIHEIDADGFDLAISLNTSLGYDARDHDASTLRRIFSGLRAGGVLLIEHLHVAAALRYADSDGRARFRNEIDGHEILEFSRVDPCTYRLQSQRWVDGSFDAQFEVQLYAPSQWLDLLTSIGYSEIRICTWSGSAIDLDTPDLLVIAKRGQG